MTEDTFAKLETEPTLRQEIEDLKNDLVDGAWEILKEAGVPTHLINKKSDWFRKWNRLMEASDLLEEMNEGGAQ